jgi:hypothetical protein
MEENYPKQSWVLDSPKYPCITGKGKCQLRHEENSTMDCAFKNDEWCKYRAIEK